MTEVASEHEQLLEAFPALPAGWELLRAKYQLVEIDEVSIDGTEPLFSLSKKRGLVRRSSLTESDPRAESLIGYKRFAEGDIVMNKMQAWNGVFGLAYSHGIISPDYSVFRVIPGRADRRYVNYLVRSAFYSDLFRWKSRGMGTAFLRLHPELLLSTPLCHPPLQIQERIADFLDRETARIDGLMGANKRLVALLEERWQNEVVTAVTHGLGNDDLVELGSPWFTRVPAMWTLEPLKRRWTVIDCKHRTPSYVDQGYPLVSHAEIQDGHVYPGRSGRLVEEADYRDLIEGRRPKRGDVIYTRNAAIGNAGYVDTDEDFAMGQDVCLISSDDQDQRFLAYFLNHVAQGQLAAQRLGATFDRINVAQIVDLQILCPPLEEQRTIANYLDARRNVYETLATRLDREIELLAEHRQALITAAVTGHEEIPAPAS